MTSPAAGPSVLRFYGVRRSILDKLTLAELEHLVARPVTGSEVNRLRREERDAAVRHALVVLYPELPVTVAAKALSRSFACYLSASWIIDRKASESPSCPRRAALFRFAMTNAGVRLRWNAIYNIARDRS